MDGIVTDPTHPAYGQYWDEYVYTVDPMYRRRLQHNESQQQPQSRRLLKGAH